MKTVEDLIERFAIRCAKGNNGGEWATHYTEEQRNVWRAFSKELFDESYEIGYSDGCGSGYNDWVAALDAMPFEVNNPGDVIAEFTRLTAAREGRG